MRKIALVTTTIRLPVFLEGLLENARHFERCEDISCIVIGDVKTPPETSKFCQALSEKFQVPVKYLDLYAQKQFLEKYPAIDALIPKNYYTRILVGNLIAYQEGYEAVIMALDDDFVTDIDFFGSHGIAGAVQELNLIEMESGWFNPYALAKEEHDIPLYFRGFPWSQRVSVSLPKTIQKGKAKVIANQGLIMEDPDVDALTRLFWPVRAVAMDTSHGSSIGLRPGTWCPLDMENTALARDIIPVYFLSYVMRRNCDIWASYVINKLAERIGDVITIGYPLVNQVRNRHDLWHDLDEEVNGNRATDQFVSLLRSIELSELTYTTALGELIEKCLASLSKAIDNIPREDANLMVRFFREYKEWHEAVSHLTVH